MKKFIFLFSLLCCSLGIQCTTKYDYIQHENAAQHGDGTCQYNCAHHYNRCMAHTEDTDTVERQHCQEMRGHCGDRCNE